MIFFLKSCVTLAASTKDLNPYFGKVYTTTLQSNKIKSFYLKMYLDIKFIYTYIYDKVFIPALMLNCYVYGATLIWSVDPQKEKGEPTIIKIVSFVYIIVFSS